MHLSEGTEIVLFEGALLVLPAEVWVAEIHTGRHGPATSTNQEQAENWKKKSLVKKCKIFF